MAWYRAGGGGIPSSLKTGMNNVLNKKFGTSTTYDPAGWPDNVNLMGPLPEKTVSGAIAQFSDGADDVPIKSLVCNVDANLSGVSSVEVVHTGKNLIDNSAAAWESGTINSSGNNASGSGTRTIGYFDVKGGGTFTLSGVIAPSVDSDFRVFFYDKNKDFISYQGYRAEFTIPENARYFRIRNISIEDISHMQIEYGSTATAYATYVAPTTHTAQLGRTIYGGSVDVVQGTGTDGFIKVKISDCTFVGTSTGTYGMGVTYSYTEKDFFQPDTSSGLTGSLASNGMREKGKYYYTASRCEQLSPIENTFAITTKNRIFIYLVGEYTAQTIQTATQDMYFIVKLATPETFTFDPVQINSLLGDNNLWADTGDISDCTYRADIALALGGGS